MPRWGKLKMNLNYLSLCVAPMEQFRYYCLYATKLFAPMGQTKLVNIKAYPHKMARTHSIFKLAGLFVIRMPKIYKCFYPWFLSGNQKASILLHEISFLLHFCFIKLHFSSQNFLFVKILFSYRIDFQLFIFLCQNLADSCFGRGYRKSA